MKLMILLMLAGVTMQAESPSRFTGTARIQLLHQLHNGTTPNGGEIDTMVESIDRTKEPPVMLNRWEIQAPYITLEPQTFWTHVSGMCDGQGHVFMEISEWGIIQITPIDRAVWEAMTKQMSFEIRFQKVTISEHSILIEEPLGHETMSTKRGQ